MQKHGQSIIKAIAHNSPSPHPVYSTILLSVYSATNIFVAEEASYNTMRGQTRTPLLTNSSTQHGKGQPQYGYLRPVQELQHRHSNGHKGSLWLTQHTKDPTSKVGSELYTITSANWGRVATTEDKEEPSFLARPSYVSD